MNEVDEVLHTIADYVDNTSVNNKEAYETAHLALADSVGCAILALKYPECTKLLGPIVPNSIVPKGSRVLGTTYILDPIRAAFNIGSMIRWLDFNDTWLAQEWGHPSDNLGGILALGDYLDQKGHQLKMWDILTAQIKAYEIQGVLALENSFNRIGFDHVILVKIATAAVATKMLGGSYDQIVNALSQAFIDTGPLRTYRHEPCTGSRKSWAAGDATSRGVQLAWMTMRNEMGYPQGLSAKRWGFYDVLLEGKPLVIERKLDSYVMENILFKISYPAEFHAQTAAECAVTLHEKVKDRIDEIESIVITTQESAIRIIDKKRKLHNPADRDHCIQYIVAVGLLYGTITSDHYQDKIANNTLIDELRDKMNVKEDRRFSRDYLDPTKRSIGNSVSITFKNKETLGPIEVEYPLGHRKRRGEALSILFQKLETNLKTKFPKERIAQIIQTFKDPSFQNLSVNKFTELFL